MSNPPSPPKDSCPDTKKVEVLVEDMLIHLDGQDAANQQFRMALKKFLAQRPAQAPTQTPRPEWDDTKIPWAHKQNEKGPFETASELVNSDFQKMLADLTQHGGRLQKNGLFYWQYTTNPNIVGRKPARKGQ